MASSHPYISGAGNITQTITQLRKNFPATVTSETIKKYGIASNNESYVINALQFIGLIDEEGKRTDNAKTLAIHDEEQFKVAFEPLVKAAYADLVETHGDGMWELDRDALVNYFRTTDQTSDIIGRRQAAVFLAFAALAGHGEPPASPAAKPKNSAKGKAAPAASKKQPPKKVVHVDPSAHESKGGERAAVSSRRSHVSCSMTVTTRRQPSRRSSFSTRK